MDQFWEEVAKKRNRGLESTLLAIANVIMVVFALGAVMFLYATINAVVYMMSEGLDFVVLFIYYILPFLLLGGGAVLLWLRRDRIKTEYEYTFTNGILDFAQVFNNKSRKALGTMNLKNIEACGKVSSGSFNRYINMQGLKRSNWFINRDADLFYLYFVKDGAKRIIVIEPSEEMEKLIRGAVRQGVYQVN